MFHTFQITWWRDDHDALCNFESRGINNHNDEVSPGDEFVEQLDSGAVLHHSLHTQVSNTTTIIDIHNIFSKHYPIAMFLFSLSALVVFLVV